MLISPGTTMVIERERERHEWWQTGRVVSPRTCRWLLRGAVIAANNRGDTPHTPPSHTTQQPLCVIRLLSTSWLRRLCQLSNNPNAITCHTFKIANSTLMCQEYCHKLKKKNMGFFRINTWSSIVFDLWWYTMSAITNGNLVLLTRL